VPHVASKASVLHAPHPALNQRERTGETKDSPSPFAMLLTDAGADPAPARNQPARTPGAIAEQRNHGQRGDAMRAEHSQRPPQPNDDCCDEGPAEVTPAAAPEQPDRATEDAADQGEATTTVPTLDITQPSMPSAEEVSAPAVGQPAITDTAPVVAAAVEAPVAPAQPAVADTPALPGAPAPAAVEAPVETAAPQTSAPALAPAPAPADATAAATPDIANGATTTAPEPEQVPQTTPQTTIAPLTAEARLEPQASPAPAQTTHHSQAPAPAHAKPATTPTVAADAANLAEPSMAPDLPTPTVPVSGAPHADTESAPQRAAHADAASHAATQANAPEAGEQPRTGSTVSEFVQANHPTPDSSHLPHLQAGRDFGQAVAATAHASQQADASNPLMSAPVPLESVAMEIAARVQGGRNRFEIRLDPPELGRIDVRLDIDRSGQVTSRLVVDKVETLDALRRDAHQLERALQDAGLKTSENGLQFSLRDQSFAGRNDQGNSDSQHMRVVDPELPATESAPPVYGRMLRGGNGIDIRV